jgi:UDPglucose 6-dehydrogenase
VTEWKAFRAPDFKRLRSALRQPVIFDGRNLYDPAQMQALGFEYFAIGRRAATPSLSALNVEQRLAA